MDAEAARRALRVDVDVTADELRAAYRSALRRTHPDVVGAGPAADHATADVVEAYRLLSRTTPGPPAARPPSPARARTAVRTEGDTVVADLPAGDVFPVLVEVAERLGDLTHVEPESGVLEFLVDLSGYGPCSVLLTLQGRATGVTEAWCTVEPLGGGPPPPPEEVATLLAAGMRATLDAVP